MGPRAMARMAPRRVTGPHANGGWLGWRNWQTRQTQTLLPVGCEGSTPSPSTIETTIDWRIMETSSPLDVELHFTANDGDDTINIYLIAHPDDTQETFHIYIGSQTGSGVKVASFEPGTPFEVAASVMTAMMLAFPVGGSERGAALMDGSLGIQPNEGIIIPSTNVVEEINK